jgi:hypothetical protein
MGINCAIVTAPYSRSIIHVVVKISPTMCHRLISEVIRSYAYIHIWFRFLSVFR